MGSYDATDISITFAVAQDLPFGVEAALQHRLWGAPVIPGERRAGNDFGHPQAIGEGELVIRARFGRRRGQPGKVSSQIDSADLTWRGLGRRYGQ
jgi:hypothetical protein